MDQRQRRELLIVALVLFVLAVGTIVHAGFGFTEAVRAVGLSVFWTAVAIGAVRAAYLPVQYIRHRTALSKAVAEDDRLDALAAAGDARARVARTIVRRRDPYRIPWYRW